MRIKIWGARGSIPVSGEQYLKYGGNTTCVEIRLRNGEIIIIDAGTGIRELGSSLTEEDLDKTLHMFFSHAHWDHIQGFPFFSPLYREKTRLNIYGCLSVTRGTAEILSSQMDRTYFPVPFHSLPSRIEFFSDCIKDMVINDARIEAIENNHPVLCHSIKVTENEKTFVFMTDNELGQREPRTEFQEFVKFAQEADCLIHDCMYLDEEIDAKQGWGHSAISRTCELVSRSGVRNFGVFHHDPERSDREVDKMVSRCAAILPPETNVFGVEDHQVIEL